MRAYYASALKDTSKNPAVPFYIGKGTGSKATDHLTSNDNSAEDARIRELRKKGKTILVSILAEDLTEHDAIKLETVPISAFGIQGNGGLLTNFVMRTSRKSTKVLSITVPSGVLEKAHIGLQLLKDSVLELSKANDGGDTNSQVTKGLNLHSDFLGGSKDYLSWSLHRILMREGR